MLRRKTNDFVKLATNGHFFRLPPKMKKKHLVNDFHREHIWITAYQNVALIVFFKHKEYTDLSEK